MAFDFNRLRTDQLQRLIEVDLDVNQLETSELEDLLASQEEFSDLGAGFASLGSALQTGLAGILGSEDLAEQARRTQEEIALRRTPDVPSIIESFEEEGVLGGLADVPEYIQEQLFFSAPQLAGQLGAGIIGTRLGGPRAGAAAAVGAGTPAFAGYNIQRQMEEQDIGIEDAQVAKAFAVGTGQAALDAVIGRTLGVFGRTEGAEQVANAAQRGLASRIARKGMEGARVEALTEAGQQALEVVQANPEKFFEFGPDVQRELAESAIAGGLIGGTISAPAGIMKPRDQAVDKQADLERHLQEEAEETRRMEEEAARFEGETLRLEAPRPGLPAPGQAAIGVPPGGFREPGVVDEVREEGVGRVEPEAESGLPAVRDVIDVPPGGFRDDRERVRETVREEGVGRAPVFEEPQAPEVLEGEVVGGLPAVREAEPAPELDIPVSTVPRPALPRGTGAIQVPPTARQRGTREGRLAGMEEVVSGVTEPTTARAEEALRERRKMELVDPFNDSRSRQLLDKLNREEQAGNTTKAKNTRQKLQERLRELGLDAEQTSRLLSGTPAEREQLRLFSQKVARQEAEQTRETAKQAYDSNTISNFNQRAERIRKDLGSELRKLGLSDVALRMDKVIRPEPETLAEGVTEQDKFGNILIALSSQIYSPGMSDAELKAKLREVMNHEMIHAMKMLGLFTDAEYQSLVKAATNQKFVDKQGNERLFSYLDRAQRLYANDTSEIQQEEAIAELFRDWAAGRKKISGKPQTLFQKIIKFIKSLGKSLNKEGFDDPSKIFEAIQSGEIGRRERRPEDQQEQRFSRRAMANPYNVNMQETIVPIYPGTENALNRKQGSVKKEVFAREMFERTNLGRLIEYNEDTMEQAARKMATEALMALQFDNNAIGWYDEKLRQAKNVVELVEPSIFASPENELAFDYALAVTSNGTAVIDNFPYALSAYRYWLQNNRFPVEDFTVGGERINDMKKSFRFYNEYQNLYNTGQIDTPLGEFLDSQYQVRDLKKVLRGLRDKYDIKISIPAGEGANAVVRGSLILGPKIGQGFYQNLRGNYNELTADMWWMRMWNRMVGNPFKPRPTAEVIKERRQKMRDQIRNPVGSLEATIIEDAIQRSGLNRSDIKSNRNLDELAVAIRSRWNSYFRKFKEEQGVNPEKPNFFRFVDTYVGGLNDQLEDAPRGPAERQFMRDTTARARELLQQEGVNINTADFQALLWYPEKRLWLSGGVAPGRGSDNDYADAAIEAAKQEGISNDRIQEALADTRPKGLAADRRAGPPDAGVDQGAGLTEAGAERFSRRPDSTTAGNAAKRVANRAGTNGQVWNVARRGGSVRQANVVASYRVDPEFAQEYSTGGISTPEVVELEQSPESAAVFAQAINSASAKSKYAPAVYIYPEADYTGMRLFMNPEGNAGFALKESDIVSVFNDPDNGLSRVSYPMIRLAFELGGRKLDAFDTVLPEIYSQNNFRAVSRLPWNDEFAPEGWDKEVFQTWNNGEPDVVFMAYDPKAKEYQEGDGDLFQDYDEAVAAQDAQAQRYSRRFSRPSESDFSLEEITNRLVEQAPETNPIMKVFDKFFFGRLEGETRWQAFTRNAINKFLPGYLLDNYVNGEITDPANSVGRAMELSQNMSGRLWALSEMGAMRFNAETGTVEVIDAPDNMGLREIFEPIGTQYEQEYYAYAIARRELKLREQGRQGFKNLSKDDAQRTVSEFEQKYPFFRDVHNNYTRFNQRMIQLGIDAGLLTQEQGDNFMDMDYVPFYRYAESAMDQAELSKAMAARAHQSLKDPNVFEKELEGGTLKLGDMYENISMNSGLILSAALKNYAMQKTADALDQATAMGGPKSWGRQAKEGDAGEKITFYKNGEKVQYIISDPALWSAVSGLNAKQKESFIKGLEMIGGILRSGVTLTPGFQLANLWRGKIDAYVKTGIEPHRFDETVKAMRDVYKNNKDVEQFKVLSGMGGYLYGADAESLAETMKRSYRLKEPGGPAMQQIGDRFKQVVTELEKTGEASELAERIVIMRKLMSEGMSEREAAFQGLNLINYGRRGAGGSPFMSGLVNFLIPTVPFLNARIQGLARLLEDPNTPGELKATAFREMAGRGMLIMAGSVALGLLAMQDEERWENETIVEKVANDIIYIGDTKIRIPKAFEVGAIFGTIPVMILDGIRQRDGSDLATAVGHIFTQTFAFDPIPQGLLPIFEVQTNYDRFRGAPIEGVALQRFPTELRAYETTPEIYKFLSRNGGALAGLSPLEIQQLVEGYLGTMATNFIASTDTLASATGAIPEKPAGTFGNPFVTSTAQVLGLNRFVREDGEGASRFVSDFYEMKRDIDQTYAAIKEASIAGQTDYVNDLLEEKGAALGFRTYFNRISRQMSEINKAIDSVRRDPNLDSVTKQERLKELRQTKTRLASQMVKAAKSSGYFD